MRIFHFVLGLGKDVSISMRTLKNCNTKTINFSLVILTTTVTIYESKVGV